MKEARGGPILERTCKRLVSWEKAWKLHGRMHHTPRGLTVIACRIKVLQKLIWRDPVSGDSGPKVCPCKGKSVTETVIYSVHHSGC